MAFYQDDRHVYRVSELDAFDWLIHGFGTRRVDIPSLFQNLATVKQVHSATVVDACGLAGVRGEGDALLENSPGAVVAIKTADCVPILLVDGRHRVVAAVHAGWRGTAAGIANRAVERMGERFGTAPSDLHAAIGPSVGECCYEVGPEVASQFGIAGRTHLDLPGINRKRLAEIGIPAERIYVSNLCTMCRPQEFHSYRRDKEAAGRMYSFAGIRLALQ